MAATTAAAAAPPKEGEGGEEDREEEEEEEEEKPEVETEDEKMTRIRAVQFPIIEEYQKILQTVFPLFIRKGAKKKTELPEKYVLPIPPSFVGSALQGRDIVMHPEQGQSLVFLHCRVKCSPLNKHLWHNWRIHLGFTMLTTMCFQFSMSNIYHLYGCH